MLAYERLATPAALGWVPGQLHRRPHRCQGAPACWNAGPSCLGSQPSLPSSFCDGQLLSSSSLQHKTARTMQTVVSRGAAAPAPQQPCSLAHDRQCACWAEQALQPSVHVQRQTSEFSRPRAHLLGLRVSKRCEQHERSCLHAAERCGRGELPELQVLGRSLGAANPVAPAPRLAARTHKSAACCVILWNLFFPQVELGIGRCASA
jgi:hypothetical protein